MNAKVENAKKLYMEGIRDGNTREAVTKYTGARYTQHSTGVRNGVEGFVDFFDSFLQRCPVRDIRIVREIVDGQFVFLQAFQNINNGESKWVTTDLFDTDDENKIVEHWDVISAYEETQSQVDQINGPAEIEDEDCTDVNKLLVRDFLCDVMVLGHAKELSGYLHADSLVIHAASNTPSIVDCIGSYDQIFRVVGQGNFVVAYCRVQHGGKEIARFDIFRVQGSKIVEVWSNQEDVPPKSEWVNGGKF